MSMRWVTAYSSLDTQIDNLDGIFWDVAPIPRRWHRCWAQTRGRINYFTRVDRCPCGAINIDSTGWGDRNRRRPSDRATSGDILATVAEAHRRFPPPPGAGRVTSTTRGRVREVRQQYPRR